MARCPKCAGTGFIQSLSHVKNGVCFDCGGTGTVAAVFVANTGLRSARAVGQAVIDGQTVDPTDVAAAFAYFEEIGPLGWRQRDYEFRNALVAATPVAGDDKAARLAAHRARRADRPGA